MNKWKTISKNAISFVLGIIFATCSIVLAETCQTTLSSSNVIYEDTTVQAETTELITQAGNLGTRVTNLENHFLNGSESYFNRSANEDWLVIGGTTLNSGVYLRSNNVVRSSLRFHNSSNTTILDARDSNGDVAGNLDLRGASVTVNGTAIGKRPVSIWSQQTFTSSTSLAYTGKSIQIPANCYFVITANVLYVNSKPSVAYLSTSTSTLAGTTFASGSSGNASHVTLTYAGTTNSSSLTFYVWAQYASAASNRVDFSGFYIPQ